jgi:hypothetical protein
MMIPILFSVLHLCQLYCQAQIIKHFQCFSRLALEKKDFFLSFLVSEVCRCERLPAADLGTNNMKLTGQLEELVQRTERTEAEVELLLAELGTY